MFGTSVSSAKDMQDMLKQMELVLSDTQKTVMIALALILGVIAMAAIIFAAMRTKKGRVFGIIVGILQPVGLFAGVQSVIAYGGIKFSNLVVFAEGSSQSAAMDAATEKLMENLLGEYLPSVLMLSLWTMIGFVALVMTLVYVIKCMKIKPKIFAILSLVVIILRWLVFAPIDQMNMVVSMLGMGEMQQSPVWTALYFFFAMLPPLFIFIQALMHKDEPAVEAPVAEVASADDAES